MDTTYSLPIRCVPSSDGLFHSRCEAMPHGVFRNAARFDKMQEIVGPACFAAGPREPKAAEGLPAHQRAGDPSINVEIPHPKLLASSLEVSRLAAKYSSRQ